MIAFVMLNIPLFDGFSKLYKTQEAKAHVEQRDNFLAVLDNYLLSPK